MPYVPDVSKLIYFIQIGSKDNVYFNWKSKISPRAFFFDYSIAANCPESDLYYHLNKGDVKLVYMRKGRVIFIIGGDISVQYQIFEALLEYHCERFLEIYGDVLDDIFETGSSDFFKAFYEISEKSINNTPQKRGKMVEAHCRLCQKNVYPYVRNSLILDSEDFPVPIVYVHEGHALLLYIDRDFKVRGAEFVSMTG